MVNHSNPVWTQKETELLLEHYKTKEMHELEKIMAGCEFPRPPEGIKRRLEKLYATGMPIDLERIRHLSIRKLWDKKDYDKFRYQFYNWRKNNPAYFKGWLAEHPDYWKRKGKEYRGKYKDYYRRYEFYTRRHIDILLAQVFDNKNELPLSAVSREIKNLTGIAVKESTLENLLSKYENAPKGSPLAKTETGNYQLNPSFYNC